MNKNLVIAIFLGLVSAEAPVWSLESVQNHRDDSQVQKSYGDYSTKKANGRPPYQSAMELAEESEESAEESAEESDVSAEEGADESGEELEGSDLEDEDDDLDEDDDDEEDGAEAIQVADDGEEAEDYDEGDEADDLEGDDEDDLEDEEDDDVEDPADIQVTGDDEEEEDHSGEFFAAYESSKGEDAAYSRVVPDRFSSDADDLFMRSMISTYALEGKNKDGSPNGLFVMDEAGTRAAAAEVLGSHKGLKGAALQKYLAAYFGKAFSHFDVNKTGKIEVIKMPQFMRFLASDQTMSLGE